MKKKLYSLWLLFFMPALSSFGQIEGWHYQAGIDSIKETGFYTIDLTPAITAHLKTDYSDLRIVNDSNKWIPHLLEFPDSEHCSTVVYDLPIIKEENTLASSEIIIKSDLPDLSLLVLTLKNTDVQRYCTLTGSDDSKSWFIINDSILIKAEKLNNGLSEIRLRFPPNNYKLYRLTINNKGKAPLNITKAGTDKCINHTAGRLFQQLNENPPTSVIQKDSGKLSYITVCQTVAYHFDKFSLKVGGVKYFSRKADLYIPLSAAHSLANPGQLLQSFTISNNSTLLFTIPVINARLFYFIIDNEDNLPVKIEEVKTYNSCHIVTAYLEKEHRYKLVMDNATAVNPRYDLQQPDIGNDHSLHGAIEGSITEIPQPAVAMTGPGNKKWLIWLTIGVAAVTLSFFTYKLIKDMKKQNI